MTRTVSVCRRTWRRLGVERATVDELAAELESDLAAAAAEGVSPTDYVGNDPARFASEWAWARGVVRTRRRLASTAGAALLGAVPGVSFALLVAYGLSSQAAGELFGAAPYCADPPACTSYVSGTLDPPEWLLLVLYALGAVFAYAGALAASTALLHWRLDPAARRTSRLLARGLPAATVSALGVGVLVAWTQGFSATISTTLAVVSAAGGIFAAATAALRLRAASGAVPAHPPAPVASLP